MTAGMPRDHGGDLDAAVERYGGRRSDWLDLSTGINPVSYPLPGIAPEAWMSLPDTGDQAALTHSARGFWDVPDEADILAAPGASALISRLPGLLPPGRVEIPEPTYGEHAASFALQGWTSGSGGARIIVSPNNPDGRVWSADEAVRGAPPLLIIDESFADTNPEHSLIALAAMPGTVILKSFGKFWGLAGLRLGFAIGDPNLIARLREALGPWPVSGPALVLGSAALNDRKWAEATRARLARDAMRLDSCLDAVGAESVGGTTLFRLFSVNNAKAWQDHLARRHIWSRIFPNSENWLRLGLPRPDCWDRLDDALQGIGPKL